MKKILVAIDGPTASGKSVCGAKVAQKLSLHFLDTGLIYRLFGWHLLKQGLPAQDITQKIIENFQVERGTNWKANNKIAKLADLQQFEVEQITKIVALDSRVRKKITKICRTIIAEKNYLLVGRDATSVIAPNADVKIYLDVAEQEQIKRKANLFKEEKKKKRNWTNIIQQTNQLEKTRTEGKLLQVADAIYVKNEHMTIEEVVNKLTNLIQDNISQWEKVLILGPTNAGKSTLFNSLSEQKIVLASKEKHTTRDWFEQVIHWQNKSFNLIDTGGVEKEKITAWQKEINERTKILIEKASLLLFVVEVNSNLAVFQNEIIQFIKRKKIKTALLVNKTDLKTNQEECNKWKAAPFETIIYLSAQQKRNLQEVRAWIENNLAKKEKLMETKKTKWEFKVLLAGRVNSGKSTLFNEMIKSNRSIVSQLPQTTTNFVKGEIIWKNKKYIFYDSAGLRKKERRKNLIEKIATSQIINLLKAIDIMVLVFDLTKELAEQEKKIVQIAKEKQIPTIIVGNKIDLVKEDLVLKKKKVYYFWKYQKKVEILFISAKSGQGAKKILKKISTEMGKKKNFTKKIEKNKS